MLTKLIVSDRFECLWTISNVRETQEMYGGYSYGG